MDFIRHIPTVFSFLLSIVSIEFFVIALGLGSNKVKKLFSKE